MNGEKINIPRRPLRILVAPLDWGLGHTTRCIPIIHLLLQSGASVLLAAEGAAKTLLSQEFPQLQILPLKGYRVLYGPSKKTFALRLAMQLPKVMAAIKHECEWLHKTAKTYQLDAVISDNRLGMYHAHIPCIYITHQLRIQTRIAWLDGLLQRIHYHYINKFTACWVPDAEGPQNLAGALSHPAKMPQIPVSYLGILSRFKGENINPVPADLLVLLSGPEPQRSIFEARLIPQLKAYVGKVVLIRGLPLNDVNPDLGENKLVFNHLPAAALETYLHGARMIIARAGYSTVMDLTRAGKKAILVATPGQTEQEYLAQYLAATNRFYTAPQQHFVLDDHLQKATEFYTSPMYDQQVKFNESPILDWLRQLQPVDYGQ